MKKVYAVLAIAILMMSVACKKDKKDETRMDIITNGTWKIVTWTAQPGFDADGDGDIDTDLYILYDPCDKDDIFTFKRTGEFVLDEGPTKCDPFDPQTSTVHWEFANNETEMIIDGDRAKIEELTNARLRISAEEMGQKHTITYGR